MKVLPVKTQVALLRALLRNWRRAVAVPRVARIVCACFAASCVVTDKKVRSVMRELLVADGDFDRALPAIRERLPLCNVEALVEFRQKCLKGGGA